MKITTLGIVLAVISVVTPELNEEMSKADFTERAEAQELSIPVYFDETGKLSNEFNVRAYLTSVYLDKNGSPQKITVGDEMNSRIHRNIILYKGI